MKAKFHKTKALLLTLLGVLFLAGYSFAQVTTLEEAIRLQSEIDLHGPSIEVPWSPEGGSRAVGDDCTNPIIIGAFPYTDANTTVGRGNTYSETCMGSYDGGEDILYQFTITETQQVTITLDPGVTTWTGIGLMNGCPQTGTCVGLSTNIAAAPHTLVKNIPAGTYYIMIDTYASPDNIPAFTLNVSVMDPPPPTPGNNCDLPILISTFPYTDVNTTVGRGNDYSETCLGSYDSGEDILYEFTLTGTRIVTITMDPGTTTYTGVGLMNTCPQAGTACLATASNSATTLRTITQTLGAGTYFIMIDTWSTPYNITSFTLNVTAELPPPPVAAINPYPANGAGAIPASVILSWSPGVGGGAADGYLLYLGTDNPPTNLANGTDLGNVLSYDPTPDLDLATEYFWQIVPYNSVGNATGNAVWSFTTTLGIGSLEGFTTNGFGVPLGGVNISIDNGISIFNTVSGPNGAYEFASIAAAPYVLTATLPGYNTTVMNIDVAPATITYQNITMARPSMAVTPNPYNVTVNPNEMLEGALNIVNNGDGSLTWTAEVVYPATDASTQYPDYLSVRGDVPTNQAPVSTGRAPSPAPFNGIDNTLASRGPDDMAYCYVASPAGGLTEGHASFILNNPAALTNFGSAASDFISSADYANGIWYGLIYGGTFGTINPTTGAFSTIGSSGDFSGISYNWTNGIMYGLTFEGVLQTINLSTGATTTVGNAGTNGFIAMEIDNDGVAYAVNIVTDQLGTINLTTGAWTVIGAFGFDANYAQDLSCDHTTNELYYAAYDTGGKLVILNKATGAASLVGAFPGGAEITGFAIPMAPGGPSGGWLTLGSYEGTVNPFGNYSIPAFFNAQGAEAGDVYTAEVIFTSEPNVGTITVPVTMVIAGPALDMPENLVAVLSNPVTGQVSLSWSFEPTDAFLNFAIRRNGVVVGYTANTNYVDMLPAFGIYDYTVQAVYDEGMSVPAGPVQVEWANPTAIVTPLYIYDEVWVNNQVVETVTISNTGEGTLTFSFPEWVEDDGNRAPLAYCAASGGCDEYIGTFIFGDQINNSSACSGYADYTSISAEVERGESYAVTIQNPDPWSSDIAAVWVDWNQNESFEDAGERFDLTQGGGGATFTGTITVPEGAVDGSTRMRVRLQYGGTLSPCGTQSFGEVEDYTLNVAKAGFITSVVPAEGYVQPGQSRTVAITWDATGWDPGASYLQDLVVNTNDLAHPSFTIVNEMYVFTPAQFAGTVTNADSGEPLNGVMVTADPTGTGASFTAITNEEGEYTMYVNPGSYDVTFDKSGFQSYTELAITAAMGVVTTLDAQLWEEAYPPSFVYAVVNAEDTQAVVTWGDGSGPYEVIYDDGSAENYAAWALPGNLNAVKFTPANYPAVVMGGKVYVGDGSFPNNNTGFIGTNFGMLVLDDDGANGLPGTVLDSISVTVNNYGWVTFTGFDVEITEGNFYLAMMQSGISPNVAPIGIDEDIPTLYRSYSRNVVNGGNWALSPFQDMMIRAIVYGSPAGNTDNLASTVSSEQLVPQKQRALVSQKAPLASSGFEGAATYRAALDIEDGSRAVTSYRVVRYSNFDPNGNPEDGTITSLSNSVTGNTYTDPSSAWVPLPAGWYAYGVAANYPNGNVSDTVVSNIVGHKILAEITVNVSLTTGGSPEGTVVTLTGQAYPYETFTATVPADGQVIFPAVWYGPYVVEAMKVGFDDYAINVNITGNRTINIILLEKKYKPRNLYVDPLTLIATWDEPLAVSVLEDFEGSVFPPAGWQALTQNTTGWFGSSSGGSTNFAIPSHTKYAVVNDDIDNGNGCCDYLITPEMDWTNLDSYRLNFASFYNGTYSQSAYIEISTDAGATWTVINTLQAAPSGWVDLEIDLTQYSGASGLSSVWLAFHADDNGEWSSGWAVDDVQIASGGVPFDGYGVFLDGTLVDNTPEETYTYRNLNYGQTYLAGVAALFSSGYSELDTYRFTSVYLIPPDSLSGFSPAGTDYVELMWLAPTTSADYVASVPEARTEMPLLSAEYSPMVSTVTYPKSGVRELWDVLLSFAGNAASMPGVETDGTFIYTSNWQGTNFAKYNADGTYVEDFTVSGSANIRDMAYDGQYFYGGQAGSTIYQMDFATNTTVSTIPTSGVNVRHIAFDPLADGGNGGYWIGDWATLALVSRTGATLQTASTPLASVYGSAYDNNTAGGPYLWLFDQGGSGAVVHQFSIPDLAMTGVTFDVMTVPGVSSSGTAGGLASSGNIIPGKFVLLANVQQDPNFIAAIELGNYSGGGGGGQVPSNLLGYNLYRDDAKVAYIEKPTLEYLDMNLDPGTYMYDITAVYDLTPYGYPGQTGESMKEGTVEVQVSYGYDLPFTEDWNTGLFTTNQWTVNGGNWRIAGQIGNPAPAAEFFYNPAQTEYSQSLTSSWINAVQYIDGNIWLDFDLKLQDLNATGDETLKVEVYNGSAWTTVKTITAEGNMDWEMQHINISSQAKAKVFRVRFTAEGMNTLDIYNWMIDNINIYRVCAEPTELTATEESSPGNLSVILNWTAPGSTGPGVSGWLAWDNGINDNAIGLTGGGTFSVAARFTPTQLAQYAGTSLTKIRMFPYAPGTTIVLKVWTGANASQLVLTQPLASYTSSVWNEIDLNTAVPVTGATELWFGYTVTHGDGVFAAGCDEGPAVAGFGDKISLDGSTWDDLSAISDISANWNLQGFVETLDGVSIPLQPISDNTVYEPVSASALTSVSYPALPGASLPLEVSGSRELVGYNVYRDGDMIGSTEETTYTDADQSVLTIGETFCYTVTAVYEDCESPMSEEACILVTDVPVVATAAVSVYPNPSNSMVNIELTNNISQVVVYNYVGQVVFEQTITKAQTIQLNVRNYEAGAYLIKFVTINGENFTKKVVVTN